MLHRGQEAAFFGKRRLAVRLAKLVVDSVSLTKDHRVAQLVVAVGEFDAVDVELEALGHRGIAIPDAGQGGLAGGVIVEDGGAALAEMGLDFLSQEEVEVEVEVEVVVGSGNLIKRVYAGVA